MLPPQRFANTVRRSGLVLLALLFTGGPIIVYLLAVDGLSQPLLQLSYLPALLVNLLLLLVFGRSLLANRKPLITALAEIAHGDLEPAVARYTLRITRLWAVFFALTTVEIALLGLFAPAARWLFAANCANCALAVALFMSEFWLRRRCLPEVDHLSFGQYLRLLRRTRLRDVGFR